MEYVEDIVPRKEGRWFNGEAIIRLEEFVSGNRYKHPESQTHFLILSAGIAAIQKAKLPSPPARKVAVPTFIY